MVKKKKKKNASCYCDFPLSLMVAIFTHLLSFLSFQVLGCGSVTQAVLSRTLWRNHHYQYWIFNGSWNGHLREVQVSLVSTRNNDDD